MKKIILCALIAINFSVSSFSQDLALATTVRDNNSYGIPAKNVSVIVARSFVKNFKEVESVNWKEKKDEYIAEFTLNGRLVLAWFTRSGNLYCTNYYGTAKHLPAVEMELVKYNYDGYEVTATTELNLQGKTVWIVSLKNCNCVRKIKISDGMIEEQEILYRSK